MRMIPPSDARSLEQLLVEEDDVPLRLLGRTLSPEHGWHAMGYHGCEILEYRCPDDELGVRTMRITRPAGTWTVEKLCECVAIIMDTVGPRLEAE